MPQWVFWTAFAQSQLRDIDRQIAMRIFEAIIALKRGTPNIKPLMGLKPYKRIKAASDYRIVYRDLPDGTLEIAAVGHRRNVYMGLRARLLRK